VLDLVQLVPTLRIPARGFEEEFSVDLNYGEKVIQLVRDEAGSLVRFLETIRAGSVFVGFGGLEFLRARPASGFFQNACPRCCE